MSLVKSTGNGMSNITSSFEERKRMLQRKDAGDAYRKQAEYFQPKMPTLGQLEDLLLGKKEREQDSPEVSAAVREYQEIEQNNRSQNMLDTKGPSIPVQTLGGPTHEKTIELLEKVRRTALAPNKPMPQDLRVAASASAKIKQVQSQILLNQEASRQIELEAKMQKEDKASIFNRSIQSDFQTPKVLEEDMDNLQKKRLKNQAIAKYSYQVHLKRYGFSDLQPSFFRIA